MDARALSRTLFRIVYSSSYTILFVVLLIFLCATPGDHIYQTIRARHAGNIPVVGATYFVTLLIAAFIYASRLYTTRQALLNIPKPYLPIEEGELGRNVRKMIVRNRQRSALIAFESRPRHLALAEHPRDTVLDAEEPVMSLPQPSRYDTLQSPAGKDKEAIIQFPLHAPPWGTIVHAGWSSPSNPDIPALHFTPVICELPHLIEAKAVSLAPPDPSFSFLSSSAPAASSPDIVPPDPSVVAQLQRNPHQSLRNYITHLARLRVLDPDRAAAFVRLYEHARFSTDALSEDQFKELMATFSEVLVSVSALPGVSHGMGEASARASFESLPTENKSPPDRDSASITSTSGRAIRVQAPSITSSTGSSESVLHHYNR